MLKYTLYSFVFLFFTISAHAELDSASQEALEKTKALLVDPAARTDAMKGDHKAIQADSYTKSVGGKNSESIYQLSSKIFEKLIIKYNGDTTKIQEVLTKAMTNPESFANSEFSPEDIKALRELSGKLPAAVSNK